MTRPLLLCLVALAMAGCQSIPFSPFVSPRVTGRVLQADNRQPLAGVTVKSGAQAMSSRSTLPPKGGELLMAGVPVRTDGDGRFTLETERALTPFRGSQWFSVQLLFERGGYESFRTNYSRLSVTTNGPAGEPLLNAGEILMLRANE